MTPVLYSLFLLWLSCYWTAATETPMETEQVIQVTEFQQVSLPCILDHPLTSSDLDLIWLGPKRNELLYVNLEYHHPNARSNAMWGMSLYRTGVQKTTWFTCNWNGLSGNPHVLPKRTKHQEDLSHSAMDPQYFSCDAPVHRNWTEGTLLWIQHDSPDQNMVLINITIRRSIGYSLDMNASFVSLILPRVTLEDAGNYSCHWKNQTCHFHLEVIAKTVIWHWMIWSVALGYMVVCLGSVFCFLMFRQVHRTRRQQKKLMSHNRRRYFYAKRNKRSISNRITVCPGNDDVTAQVDAYENVQPEVGAQRGQRLLQKGKILPDTLKMEADEEEYECPDSETELKSDEEEHYENAQEEVKPLDVTLNDVLVYENKDKVKFDLRNGNLDGSWYSNKTEQILENLTQDQEPIVEDNENYINLEEECPMSSGTARLIAGLRLQLALNIHKDRQDGSSEPSTGSHSYEEMNGSLCPTASKLFHLHTNTSNEEAPPLVKLGSTNVQLTKPSTVACTATDFYPGKISMTWFRNDRIVQGPEQPPAQPSTGQLFRAESVLKLIPEFSDASDNFSCHIHHQAHKGPKVLNFQLRLQARPILELITRPQGEKFVAAECNVNKFYPSPIHIQWLQNGVPQEFVKSKVHHMPNGMFSINSVLFPKTSSVKLTYVCRVEHEALETPLEQSVLWRPGTSAVIPWLLGFILGLGSGLALAAGIAYYKVKSNSVTGTPI